MDQDVWNRDDGHLAQGVRLVAAALVSAVLTASVVIAVGQSLIDRQAAAHPSEAALIRTVG
ncbi:MAG: hypothetical protein KKA16_12220 [Alphaproteobacteria bacterium]|nr:hypothetical protein [Alphaproteobacteria bacterium]